MNGVFDGYQFLEDVFIDGVDSYLKNNPQKYQLGKQVIVIGGGDTALDCARTALRLTQGDIKIAYRRTENDMPADPIMLQEAKEEGVEFVFLVEPKAYEGENGSVKSITMNRMKLGTPDQTGRKSPEPILNHDFKMECSSVLLAVGRGPNSFIQTKAGIKTGKHDSIAIDNQYITSIKGVFYTSI